MSERQSQSDRVLDRLKQGPATSWELQQLGICSHTSRISELRKLGHDIVATDQYRGRKRIVTYTLKGQKELFSSFDNNTSTRLGPSLGLA